jgi:hypothetical protein
VLACGQRERGRAAASNLRAKTAKAERSAGSVSKYWSGRETPSATGACAGDNGAQPHPGGRSVSARMLARVGKPSIAPPTRRRPFRQARWQAPRERRQGVGNPKQKRPSVARSEREAPLVRGRPIPARHEQHEERGRSHRRPQVVVDRASSEAAHGRHDDERPLPALLPERLPGSSSRRLASPAPPAPPTSCRAVRLCTTECQNIHHVGRGQMIRGKLEGNLVVHTGARDCPMRRQRARPCQVYERRNPGPTRRWASWWRATCASRSSSRHAEYVHEG